MRLKLRDIFQPSPFAVAGPYDGDDVQADGTSACGGADVGPCLYVHDASGVLPSL